MNKKFTLIIFASLFTFVGAAQNSGNAVTKWKISSFGQQGGMVSDSYKDMSMDWMLEHTKNTSDLDFDNSGYDLDAQTQITGMNVGLNMSIAPYNFGTKEFRQNQEITVSTNLVVGREAMIEYTAQDADEENSDYRESTIFCLVEKEFNVSASYIYKKQFGRFFGGAGLGASYAQTFGNKMLRINSVQNTTEVFEQNQDSETITYEANNSEFYRVYIPLRFGIDACERWSFFSELRLGGGQEKIETDEVNRMSFHNSVLFSCQYKFKYSK